MPGLVLFLAASGCPLTVRGWDWAGGESREDMYLGSSPLLYCSKCVP